MVFDICVHARMDWSCALIDGDDDNDENSAQEQERRARRCVGYRGARNGEYVQSRDSEEQTKRCVCMYVCGLNRLTLPADPLFLVQCYQSRGPSSRSLSLCIVQNLAAAGVTQNGRRQCWMALTSKLSCTVTSSVFGPRIERGGSSSTRRPSSSDRDGRWARARLSFSFGGIGMRAFCVLLYACSHKLI
jgi:hypothetical protein